MELQSLISSIANIPFIMNKWIPHNCPACVHMGQPRNDTRKRAGIRFESDGSFSFNCFNCGFKTYFKPGFDFNTKLVNLVDYYGATNEQKTKLILLARDLKETNPLESENTKTKNTTWIPIEKKPLPLNSKLFTDWATHPSPPKDFIKVLDGVMKRNPNIINAFELYWSPETELNMNQRFIIPYYYNSDIIGWSARTYYETKRMKYINQFPSNILYNIDILNDNDLDIIYVTEGPINAGMIGGVATNHYTMKDHQIDILTRSKKKIVIVPDRDKDGMKMIEQAIQCGFSVSLPPWGSYLDENGDRKLISDVEQAVRIYGRLYTAYMIRNNIHDDALSIRVFSRKWIS